MPDVTNQVHNKSGLLLALDAAAHAAQLDHLFKAVLFSPLVQDIADLFQCCTTFIRSVLSNPPPAPRFILASILLRTVRVQRGHLMGVYIPLAHTPPDEYTAHNPFLFTHTSANVCAVSFH